MLLYTTFEHIVSTVETRFFEFLNFLIIHEELVFKNLQSFFENGTEFENGTTSKTDDNL